MSSYRRHLVLAAAAKLDLAAKTGAFHAAVLRGDLDQAEQIREEAHSMLESLLDHYAAAAKAGLVEGEL